MDVTVRMKYLCTWATVPAKCIMNMRMDGIVTFYASPSRGLLYVSSLCILVSKSKLSPEIAKALLNSLPIGDHHQRRIFVPTVESGIMIWLFPASRTLILPDIAHIRHRFSQTTGICSPNVGFISDNECSAESHGIVLLIYFLWC